MRYANCHSNKKHYCKGLCKTCYERNRIVSNPVFAKNLSEYRKQWKSKNPEKYAASRLREKCKIKTSEMKDNRYFYLLRYYYGLSEADYFAIKIFQQNKCGICLKPPKTGKRLVVDHNHLTGYVRGLLCVTCNSYFSKIDNDPTTIGRISHWLSKTGAGEDDLWKGNEKS